MTHYRSMLRAEGPSLEDQHLQDLALVQLLAVVLALTALLFMGA